MISNDLKFWVARFVVLGCILIDLGVLVRTAGLAMSQRGGQTGPGLAFWIAAFFVVCLAGMASTLWYYRLKARRFTSAIQSADKLAVETLAGLGASKRKDR